MAQVAHAAAHSNGPAHSDRIVLRGSIEDVEVAKSAAVASDIPFFLVVDAGKTQLESGTPTVLSVGPAPKELVGRITKHLKLY